MHEHSALINEHNLHYVLSGNEDPCVFLHHSYGCVASWGSFHTELAQCLNLNWMAYDRKGYGKSDSFDQIPRDTNYHQQEAEELLLLLDRIGIEKCYLYGFSDGGNIALEALALDGDRFHGAIVTGVHTLNQEITKEGIRHWDRLYLQGKLDKSLSRMHSTKSSWVHNVWAKSWLLPQYENWNCFESLKKIKVPVLAIQGLKDEFGDIQQIQMIEKYSQGLVNKLILAEAGHSVHKDQPQEVIKASVSFINSLRTKNYNI